MKLSALIKNIDSIDRRDRQPDGIAPNRDPEITSIHYRSQEVVPGGLFVAITGHQVDGHDYIGDAIARGAVAVVTQKPVEMEVTAIQVVDTRKALADVAVGFYRRPSESLVVAGITGTNGKTTTAYLVESILAAAGFQVGVIGTIDYRYGGRSFENPVTTPESLDLARILSEMAAAGITHVVTEVSSHAIALGRIRNCWLDTAVFTNLSQDHLDFHGDMQSYWACKKALFTEHLARGPKSARAVAVINSSNAYGKELAADTNTGIITIGADETSQVHPQKTECGLNGILAQIATPRGEFEVRSALVGPHNVENMLCAVGVAEALDLPLKAVVAGINQMPHVPGRLEPIENEMGRFVYVDYAHTPDALENVLTAIATIANGRIICVFGCGGDRDRGKRPLMGAIAAGKSDLAIVTSDNPRTEDPLAIIDQIVAGIVPLNATAVDAESVSLGFDSGSFLIEPDRKKAIRLAVRAAQPGDIVLIAGKGHETYQILGQKSVSFDDRQQAREALAGLQED